MTLLFNPSTKLQLTALAQDLPQAILLTGDIGVGLKTTALFLAGHQLAGLVEPVAAKESTKAGISVARIRELYDQSHSKSRTRQIFIIDDADTMSAGAQNAFLKLLEEPNSPVAFILTSHQPSRLLATVISRVEQLSIPPITREQSEQLLQKYKLPPTIKAQLLFIASGHPADLTRLANDSNYQASVLKLMSTAKVFMSGTKLERSAIAFSYATDRQRSLELLRASIALMLYTLNNHPLQSTIDQLGHMAAAYDAITANGNVRLHLMTTVL